MSVLKQIEVLRRQMAVLLEAVDTLEQVARCSCAPVTVWTDERKARLRVMFAAGATDEAIGDALGVSDRAVALHRVRLGLRRKPPQAKDRAAPAAQRGGVTTAASADHANGEMQRASGRPSPTAPKPEPIAPPPAKAAAAEPAPKCTRRGWSPAEDEALRDWLDEGGSVLGIGARLNRTSNSVYTRMDVLGLTVPARRPSPADAPPAVTPAPPVVDVIPAPPVEAAPVLRERPGRIAADRPDAPRPLVAAMMAHLARLPVDPAFGAEGDLRLLVETAQGTPVGEVARQYGQSAAAGVQRLGVLVPAAILDQQGAPLPTGHAALLEAAKRLAEAGHE